MKKIVSVTLAVLALTWILAACAASPETSAPGYIDLESAKTTALGDAQLSSDDASFTTAKLEEKNGLAYYDLHFTDGTSSYYCAVDATTGAIIESGLESDTAGDIGEDKAKAIALEHAGVAENDTSYLSVKRDFDDGVLVYDVEFYAKSTEYDYEIDSATGKIRSYDYDAEGYSGSSSSGASSTAQDIGEAEAKAIALEHAGVAEDDTSYLKVQKDYDDGALIYEVEFYAGSTEYDYEIDAASGKIRTYDYDAEGYTPPASNSAAKSQEEVQKIALAKVPGATAEHIRLQLDQDDGKLLYEGTIIYDGMEYEFEIDAYSGAILEWDAESIYD